MSTDLVDTYKAAEEMGISRPTLYRLMEQYQVKKYRVPGNRKTLIRREDMARMLQPQEVPGKVAA